MSVVVKDVVEGYFKMSVGQVKTLLQMLASHQKRQNSSCQEDTDPEECPAVCLKLASCCCVETDVSTTIVIGRR